MREVFALRFAPECRGNLKHESILLCYLQALPRKLHGNAAGSCEPVWAGKIQDDLYQKSHAVKT
jgi:hypothetical protein